MAMFDGRAFLTSLFDSLSTYHRPGSSSRHAAPTRSVRTSAGLEPPSFVVEDDPVCPRANVEAAVAQTSKDS